MSYERPAWAGGTAAAPPDMPRYKTVTVDTHDLVRTRDALGAAFLGLSAALDRAVKAYLDHVQTVVNGDTTLNVSYLVEPFNVFASLGNPAALAQLALQQGVGNGTVAPMMLNNALPGPVDDPAVKGKRKKRAYKQRDPNAPKRPLTAYFRYLGENRASIAEEIKAHPETFSSSGKPGDISRIATDRWNALTQEQQEPYRNAYQAALKEYEKEVERYKAAGGAAEAIDAAAKVEDAAVGALAVEAAALASEDEDSSEDEDAPVAAPPPPPPAPVEKAPKKSALKKTKAAAAAAPAAPAPVFSTINPEAAVAVAPAPAPVPVVGSSSSPERKRKGAAGAADAEGGPKKRSRKSAAEKEVVAAPDPDPVPAPVVAPSSPEVEAGGKKKKQKKKSTA